MKGTIQLTVVMLYTSQLSNDSRVFQESPDTSCGQKASGGASSQCDLQHKIDT